MSVLSLPLHEGDFSIPEDRSLTGNGPARSSSEFSSSEHLGQRQGADAGIPDGVKAGEEFQQHEETGCSGRAQPPEAPADAPSRGVQPRCLGPRSLSLSGMDLGPLLHLGFCLCLSVLVSLHASFLHLSLSLGVSHRAAQSLGLLVCLSLSTCL